MKYTVTPDIPGEGIAYVNHHEKRRSGHLGHALVEYADGKLLSFYSNCAGSRNQGHSGFGWMEYRRSEDGGQTWGEPQVLPYSARMFLDGEYTISCEKAVRAPDGTIVVVCLVNDCEPAWEPWGIPTVIRSSDGGQTWTEPVNLGTQAGRVYDLRVHEDTIYALLFANDAQESLFGSSPEHQYKLLVSRDNGLTFSERSTIPFETEAHAYGSLLFSPDGMLAAYTYNARDEYHLDYCVSADSGATWTAPAQTELAKRIRNPQTAYLNGLCFMHGRSGCVEPGLPKNLVLYTSEDGIHWDSGVFLRETPEGAEGGMSYDSNNLVTGTLGSGKQRLLIQASCAYDEGRTDVRHWWVDVE